MKEKELKKLYRYDSKQHMYYIDIQLEDYRDAYSNWDYSPFNNRDLDDDLTEYLLACSYEIPWKQNIAINFHLLHQQKDEGREAKSIQGMYNYFEYQLRKLRHQRIRKIRDTLLFFLTGTILLLIRAFVDQFLVDSIFGKLIVEGFLIGGWVMIWEMFSTWFFYIKELTYTMKHFNRLKDTSITYTYKEWR